MVTAREYQRSEDDLAAQQSMALSAFVMLWVSGILGLLTLGLSGYAAFLLRDTLNENRRTANAAVEATEAAQNTFAEAKRANEIAREGLVAQHRPWLVIQIESVGPVRFREFNNVEVDIDLKVKNIGGSPATMVIYDVHAHWTNPEWPSFHDIAKLVDRTKAMESSHAKHAGMILPNDDSGFGFVRLVASHANPDQFASPRDRNIGIVVACCVVYRSMFSDQWHHTANLIYVRRKVPEGGHPRDVVRFKWTDGDIGPEELRASISKSGGTSSIA